MHVMLIVLSAGTCRVHASIVASVCECLLGVSLVDTCYAEVALGWNMMVPLYLGIVLVSTSDWMPYGFPQAGQRVHDCVRLVAEAGELLFAGNWYEVEVRMADVGHSVHVCRQTRSYGWRVMICW